MNNINSCNTGIQYCSDGYGLYFPCLKSITKGQDVCFDFYIADNSTKDVIDLRDVDDITLNLSGVFGCPYGVFSYPDNIESLQSEEFEQIYENRFGGNNIYTLTIIPLDIDGNEILESKSGNFYSGTEVTVAADDTYEYIFVGWVGSEEDELCEDDIKSGIVDHKYVFNIYENKTIYAIYRKRRVYTIQNDPTNINGIFNIWTDNGSKWFPISNKNIEYFDDCYDEIEVLEGHTFAAWCRPNIITIDKDNSKDDDYMYEFRKWDDGEYENLRYIVAGDGTFERDEIIYLKAICELKEVFVESEDELPQIDIRKFNTFGNGVYIETEEFDVDKEYPYVDDTIIFSKGNIFQRFDGNDGYIRISNGCSISIPTNIENGIRIDISAKGECDLIVKVNGNSMTPDEWDPYNFSTYTFYLNKCDNSNVEITSNGDCYIDSIEIFKENVIDKGKASLCLDSETTSILSSGKLSVSCAIMVNGKAYGLPQTLIGEVNKLNKIDIL